ncbi:MAG: sugar transferase [Patescibacteria group bacterium]|nr:sugar transferase [Patescibacteria group bacterium]MBU2508970.1 sugar transferase [Patescibacteria group bacterium]
MRIRRIDLTFTTLQLPLDILALYAAGVGAYLLRFSRFVTEVRPVLQDVPFAEYIQTVSVFVAIWILLFILAGLFSTRPRKAWNEFGRIALACTAGTMLLIAIVFFQREIATSRFIVLAVWIFSILFVTLERLSLRTMRHMLLKAQIGHKKVVIIGKSTAADKIAEEYKMQPILGFTVIKKFADWNDETKHALDKLRKKQPIDVIVLADPDLPKSMALDLIAYTEQEHITFNYLADLFAARFSNIEVSTSTGLPIIEVKRTPLDGWGRIAKRAFDILFSLIVLIITSPVQIILMLAILIEDGMPLIFQNIRVGEEGDAFKLYKLRSMYRKYSIGPQFSKQKERLELEEKLIEEKSIKQGPVYKIAEDPRVTKVGKFIRRWSLDELAQFWNVLKGDMSVVGPRPHQPREVEKYLPQQRRVLAIRPGITGLAQISGRSDLEFEDEIKLDAWYIENWSLWLDLYIVLKTPFTILYRKGVY